MNLIMFFAALIISFVPCAGVFLWLRNGLCKDLSYRKICDKTLFNGMLCVFPALLVSAVFAVALRVIGLKGTHPILYQFLYTFIVLAFAEELVKYLTFKKTIGMNRYEYSWLNLVALMSIVGIGFDIVESVVYAIGASVPIVLIRGLCVPHAGYGFIVGYFYGKAERYKKPAYTYIGFVISWLMHGTYDFALSEEVYAINEYVAFIAVILAIADIVLWVCLIIFSKKKGKTGTYAEPLLAATKKCM